MLLRVAAVQLNSGADMLANLTAADTHTRAAARDGAQLIVLPEKWSVIGTEEDLRAGAQTLDGEAIRWACSTAAELGVEIIAGSICETQGPDRRLLNTSVHIDRHGQLRGVYRKLHMFDVNIAGHEYNESAHEQPGEDVVCSTTAEGVRVGMSICYDLRFPELYRILVARGALVIAVPAAFTLATTRDHWEVLLRARAIENQCCVIAANQIGQHPGGYHSGGRSMIIDAWGIVLAQADDSPGYITATVDLNRQQQMRASLPALSHRRLDIYGYRGQEQP